MANNLSFSQHEVGATRWVRNRVLAKYLGVSEVTIWKWQRNAGLGFPAPSIVCGHPYTDLDEVDAWMKKRVVRRARAEFA